ncbi:intraflagellar transport protein 25 homolog isoform X2 [Rhineura floridana]|uniref:intraflagellar transport protein 25 homolog isoform X2 n=1 Tax=Rhineura floridana TaxID=261503 RepID=UPI002AC821FF|nr:intraflagellar transport protein 25 homolog isoform X2 [Rhineura floridana]
MKFTDYCLSSEGADVILATSSDEKYPPENITDGVQPKLPPPAGEALQSSRANAASAVLLLMVAMAEVQTLRIEKSVSKDPINFEQCVEKELQYKEGELQIEAFSFPEIQATYLRFIILSAFDAFVSVHRVIAEGIAQDI